MIARAKLAECPFCGQPAERDFQRPYCTWPDGERGSAVSISCSACSVEMMLCREDHPGVDAEDLMGELEYLWNRRKGEAE